MHALEPHACIIEPTVTDSPLGASHLAGTGTEPDLRQAPARAEPSLLILTVQEHVL